MSMSDQDFEVNNDVDDQNLETDQGQTPEFSQIDEEEPVDGSVILPKDAFVTTSDWTTETIVSQLAKGSIDVNPGFQRRDAWDLKRKRLFIESVFIGIPIPQLVLAEKERGQYIVLDGKQRLLTLLSFSESFRLFYTHQLKLQKLPYLPVLNGKTWGDIQKSPELMALMRAFENAPIRTVLIRNWKTEEFLNVIFNRLNTGSLPLSSQELRAALHPGPYAKFLEESSASNESLQTLLRIRRPDFRMRDAEIQLRATAFDLLLESYSGSLREFLNRAQATFNSNWAVQSAAIEDSTKQFTEALSAINSVFKFDAGRRYTSEGYERTMNRAVLDALIYCFRHPACRAALLANPKLAREAYENVCLEQDFSLSVQLTTKTPQAVSTRINSLVQAYNKVFDINIPGVELVENRLRKQ